MLSNSIQKNYNLMLGMYFYLYAVIGRDNGIRYYGVRTENFSCINQRIIKSW